MKKDFIIPISLLMFFVVFCFAFVNTVAAQNPEPTKTPLGDDANKIKLGDDSTKTPLGDDANKTKVGGAGNTGTNSFHNIMIPNPLKPGIDNLYSFLIAVIQNVILPLGAVIATLAILYSGFLFVTAQGNDDKLNTAKTAFFYSVIGAAILLGSYVIATAIETTMRSIGVGN